MQRELEPTEVGGELLPALFHLDQHLAGDQGIRVPHAAAHPPLWILCSKLTPASVASAQPQAVSSF